MTCGLGADDAGRGGAVAGCGPVARPPPRGARRTRPRPRCRRRPRPSSPPRRPRPSTTHQSDLDHHHDRADHHHDEADHRTKSSKTPWGLIARHRRAGPRHRPGGRSCWSPGRGSRPLDAWRRLVLPALSDAQLAREALLSPTAMSDDRRVARARSTVQVERAAAALEQRRPSAPDLAAGRLATTAAGALRGLAFAIEADRLLRHGAAAPRAPSWPRPTRPAGTGTVKSVGPGRPVQARVGSRPPTGADGRTVTGPGPPARRERVRGPAVGWTDHDPDRRPARQGPDVLVRVLPAEERRRQATLVRTLRELEPLGPSFVSVTYRGRGRVAASGPSTWSPGCCAPPPWSPMAHLICVAHSRLELAEILVELTARPGVENLMALGGDPPTDPDAGHRGAASTPRSWWSWPGPSAGSPSGWRPSPPATRSRPTWRGPRPPGRQAGPGRLRRDPVLLRGRRIHRPGGRPGRPGRRQAGAAGDHAGHQRSARCRAWPAWARAVPGWMVERLEAADAAGGAEAVRHEGVACATELCQQLLEPAYRACTSTHSTGPAPPGRSTPPWASAAALTRPTTPGTAVARPRFDRLVTRPVRISLAPMAAKTPIHVTVTGRRRPDRLRPPLPHRLGCSCSAPTSPWCCACSRSSPG